MYTLVCSVLAHKGLIQKPHVQNFLSQYHLDCLDIDIPQDTWDTEEDILGFVYQSLLSEGEKNATGQYYTPRNVVEYILKGMTLDKGETFLDPCCGSGAFLMGVQTDTPENLYGFDISNIAVMIATTNLLIKYHNKVFCPNIFCMDYLDKSMFAAQKWAGLPYKYNHIYTNPPWGSDKAGRYTGCCPLTNTKERASMVIAESLTHLQENGTSYFLLPTSLLKTKSHSNIRKHILSSTSIQRIDLYNNRFDGVFTDYFGIKVCTAKTMEQKYIVTNNAQSTAITLSKKDYRRWEHRNQYAL